MAAKRIVVFADGTGNAFTTQESNVWRIYRAMDESRPDQIARYIKGVGTSGFRPFSVLDGATGVGVPGNVRKLYRFICWNWNPGDEIYMFGFSRGAFTIRTLVGLIDSEGLVPRSLPGIRRIGRSEMERNVMAAWRAYRARTIPWRRSLPTIWATRLMRDAWLSLYHGALGHRGYDRVRWETWRQQRRTVPIGFVGLFDTVEAFGVPVEELRGAIDWALWPISFRNRRVSNRVHRVRHALALDDERTSFHPLRFERAPGMHADVQEVWFAGMHSDVGGGYPDGSLAFVPLAWMADEAAAAGLRFQPGTREQFHACASSLGPMHDSRSGASVMYRYAPRPIADDDANGGAPTIHHSVTDKMVYGTENYAPLTMPRSANVLMPGGAVFQIQGFATDATVAVAPPTVPETPAALTSAQEAALLAVRALNSPNMALVERVRDAIWWRRTAYFAMVVAVALAATLPATADWLAAHVGSIDGMPDDGGVAANLQSLSQSVAGLLPGYVASFVEITARRPLVCGIVFLLAFALYAWNAQLRNVIGDRAVTAWFDPGDPTLPTAPDSEPDAFDRVARWMRRSTSVAWLHWLSSSVVAPAMFLLLVGGTAIVTASRTTVSYRAGSGTLCPVPAASPVALAPGDHVQITRPFRAQERCWASGIELEAGRRYTIRIETDDGFFDQRYLSSVSGFQSTSVAHRLALPFRRWWSAEWFAPIARIGVGGNVEWRLVADDGSGPSTLVGNDYYSEAVALESWEPLPEERRREFWEKRRGHAPVEILESTFTAQATGELFLYLNDVIVAVPFWRTSSRFYDNNAGTARITIARQPAPNPATSDGARQAKGATSSGG